MSYQDQDQRGLGEGPVDTANATKTLWQTLEADGRFTRFLQAARETHLETELNLDHKLTVFAVTDETLASETRLSKPQSGCRWFVDIRRVPTSASHPSCEPTMVLRFLYTGSAGKR